MSARPESSASLSASGRGRDRHPGGYVATGRPQGAAPTCTRWKMPCDWPEPCLHVCRPESSAPSSATGRGLNGHPGGYVASGRPQGAAPTCIRWKMPCDWLEPCLHVCRPESSAPSSATGRGRDRHPGGYVVTGRPQGAAPTCIRWKTPCDWPEPCLHVCPSRIQCAVIRNRART